MDSYLPEAVELLLDMMRNSILAEVEIDSERNVVLEEINMHNDSPDELVHDVLIEAMWDGHRLGHMVLGDAAVIKSVDRSSLIGYLEGSYVTSRLVAAAAGAVEHSAFVDMIERGTSGMPSGAEPDRGAGMAARGTRLITRKDTEQAHITIGTDGLQKNHPDRFALAIVDNILGGSMSSRLFQKIREERGLVYSIYSYSSLFMGMGMVGIYAGTHPSQAPVVLDLIDKELRAVGEKGFRPEEVERACNHIRGSLYISNEDSASRMSRIAKAEISGGEQLSIDEIAERVQAVTLEDLQRVFRETWGSGSLSLAVIGPFDENDLQFPSTLEAG
jgi:predicted Zn-dependent peptidase